MSKVTFVDTYISSNATNPMALNKFYDTILMADVNNPHSICRVPINDIFSKYRSQLEVAEEWYRLDDILYYKPKTVSAMLYGTTELWLSLLRVNNMRNITEFSVPWIKIYSPNMLKTLLSVFFKRNCIR